MKRIILSSDLHNLSLTHLDKKKPLVCHLSLLRRIHASAREEKKLISLI